MVIYKTTNLINGKYYIGKDHANNPNYLGSGLLLLKAIDKYGKLNFKKEIIYYCDDLFHLAETEKNIVNETFCKDKMTYNLAIGGAGGYLLCGASEDRIKQWKANISNSVKGDKNPFYGKTQSDDGKRKISESNKRPEHPNNNRNGENNPFYNKSHTQENKNKWSIARSGSKNPMAKKCIANGIEYGSTKEAGIAIGISPSTVRQRINSNKWEDYKYV